MTGDNSTNERLAKLEVEVEGLRASLVSQFSGLTATLETLSLSIGEARRPRWDTWAAWTVVALTVIGGGAWAMNERFVAIEDRTDRNYQTIGALSAQLPSYQEKLGEVETQFRTGGQIFNQTDYRHDVLLDQLWRREFGQSLREDSPWPVLGKER